MSIHNERFEEMATMVWNHAFHLLDGEIDFTTDDACRAANAARAAFERSLTDWLHPLVKPPDGWGVDPEGGLYSGESAVIERLRSSINGLNATMRATDIKYRASQLCNELSALIRDVSSAGQAAN